MNGFVTISARSPEFQRSFVALCYYFGARGDALAAGLGQVRPHAATSDLLAALSQPERDARAQALGTELSRLATALDQRGLVK